jgi:hypothetical protein
MSFEIGKYYMVHTASGSDVMKLVHIKGNKATVSTYNTLGYGGKKPIKIDVDLNQIKAS